MTRSVLRAERVSKRLGGRDILREVTIEVCSGEVVGLLGPNGAGKTTTFYSIVGLVRPDAGQVSLDGEVLTSEPMHVRARRGLSYLPQEASVFRSSPSRRTSAILETPPLPARSGVAPGCC
jgi:lipopolysaccharide export system ATP-binding protein